MNGKLRLVLVIALGIVLLASSIGVTRGSFINLESSVGSAFQAWASTPWVQTTQGDFEAGVLNNVDTSSSPGDVKLATTSNWYNTSWAYRRAITIDHTKVSDVTDPSTTYANFPLLVYATGLSNIKANGADIRFTLSDGTTEIPREIESYSGGTLWVWVKTTLTKDSSDSTDDVIYMYYGNLAASEPPEDSTYGAKNVWDSNHKGVWHLNETSGTHYDSTSNDNDGTPNGGVTQDATGPMNGADGFDGSDDYVNCGQDASLNITAASITIEGWINMDADPGDGNWYDCISKPTYNFYLGGTATDVTTLCAWFTIGGLNKDIWGKGDIDINPGNDTYCVVTYDGTDVKAYVNGQLDYTELMSGSIDDSATDDLIIGAFSSPAGYFDGIIDEVRISNIARSADWIKTCYNNQSSPSTFHSVGSEQQKTYVSPGTIASQVLDNGVAGARWDALFWDETRPSNTDIAFEVRASDTPFVKGDASPSWTSVGGTFPVTSGRYMQWRAILTTSDPSQTPTLHEVRVYYSDY